MLFVFMCEVCVELAEEFIFQTRQVPHKSFASVCY